MVLGTWEGIHYLHRPEDLVIMEEALSKVKPKVSVELGTYFGGFTGMLSDMVKKWDGIVHTFDKEMVDGNKIADMLWKCENVDFHEADVIGNGACEEVTDIISDGIVFLYCDNGDKNLELELYAPYLNEGSIIGTHDYGTECEPKRAEAFMKQNGFKQYYHKEFAALAHPVWYPHSLTRFWMKEAITYVI